MNSFLTQIFISDVTVDDNWFKSFREFIEGFKDFISSLNNIVHVIFPFFTDEEIAFVITFLLIFINRIR